MLHTRVVRKNVNVRFHYSRGIIERFEGIRHLKKNGMSHEDEFNALPPQLITYSFQSRIAHNCRCQCRLTGYAHCISYPHSQVSDPSIGCLCT